MQHSSSPGQAWLWSLCTTFLVDTCAAVRNNEGAGRAEAVRAFEDTTAVTHWAAPRGQVQVYCQC